MHVFCIEERKLKDSGAKAGDVVCPPIPAQLGDHRFSNLHITIPARTVPFGPAGNPSSYMIDGGLWTACKESQAVMERKFKHESEVYRRYHDGIYTRRDIGSPVPKSPFKSLDIGMVLATEIFLSAASIFPSPTSTQTTKADHPGDQNTTFPYYLTVLPHQDLLILRPSSWEVGQDYWFLLQRGFRFASENHTTENHGSRFNELGWRQGLAFEFDPAWTEVNSEHFSEVPEGDGYAGGRIMVERMARTVIELQETPVRTVWLIDYRLRLRQDTSANNREPGDNQKVFYGNNGLRYVEVCPNYVAGGGDHLKWFYTEGIEGEGSVTVHGSCYWFIEEVEDILMEVLSAYSDDERDGEARSAPKLGMLACLR